MRTLTLHEATTALQHGAVVAHATEGVIGLACDPRQPEAIAQILAIKQRPAARGLILAAGTFELLKPWLDWEALTVESQTQVLDSWPGAETWLIPAAAHVSSWVRGDHRTVAVRVSAHPAIVALSTGLGSPIISTSANLSGEPAVSDLDALSDAITTQIAGIYPSTCTQPGTPSRIRDARSLDTLRS